MDLARGLHTTVQLVKHALREAGVELQMEVPEGLPCVEGDARALNQVFLNLLKNAAEALAWAGWDRSRLGPRGGRLPFWCKIRDDGPGIAAELLPKLFEPFYSTKQAGRGTGLGLVDQPAGRGGPRRHDRGEFGARRGDDLRGDASPAGRAPCVLGPTAFSIIASIPILCVDDEPENLRLFELAFKREFSIVTAESGEEGLERLNSEPVALVLSDHRMPGMSGVEFLTRACELDPKTIRILVTAYGDAQTLGSAINSGAIYKYIPKPWMPDEMRLMLRRGIETYALDREREQLVRELTLLNRVSRSITQELALEPLLDLLLETLTEELGYDGAGILFFDNAEQCLSQGRFAPADSAVSESLRDLEISQRDRSDLHRPAARRRGPASAPSSTSSASRPRCAAGLPRWRPRRSS